VGKQKNKKINVMLRINVICHCLILDSKFRTLNFAKIYMALAITLTKKLICHKTLIYCVDLEVTSSLIIWFFFKFNML